MTYTLFEIVIVTIAAMLSGSENYKQIADFARVKIKWLNKFGLLESGAPSYQTIARLIGLIDPVQFEIFLSNGWKSGKR